MAYRPSRRQTRRASEALEPNMAPIMNLMVVLIPLLLSSAQLIKISMIELNLPPASTDEALTSTSKKKKQEGKVELAITITDKGFYLTGPSSALQNKRGKLVILKQNGEYDYPSLARQLYAIKVRLASRKSDTNAITIQAEPQVDYQTLVSTMDAARSIKVDGNSVILFPKASMSALLL